MSFFKKIWKAVTKVAPVVAGYALGGPAGAAIGGGLGSAARGGNLSQILQGAGYGYAGGSILGAGANALAAGGANLAPGAAGPVTSGLGGYAQTLSNSLAPGLTSAIKSPVSSLTNILSGGGAPVASGGSSFGGLNTLSGIGNLIGQEKAKDQLLEAQKRSLALNAPYLETGNQANQALQDRMAEFTSRYSPEDLANDPGYQFQLEQGTQALNRANAAGGNLNSGAALKAAQEFGTGLADKTYNEAFQRWLQNNAQNYGILSGQQGVGMNAAGNAAGAYENIGNIKSNSTNQKYNTLTGILSGAGARQIIGYTADNKPIYA